MLLAILGICLTAVSAHAADASLDPNEFGNAAALLAESTLNAVVKTVGIAGEFRPILGATPPSGLSGTTIGASAHVSQAPTEFTDALTAAGYTKPPFSSIPAAHLQIQQRLASFWSFGAGYLKYKNFKLMGATTQFSWATEEGPVFALRATYSKNELGFVETQTWTPALVVSKPLLFFEPYLGAGLTQTRGDIRVPLTISGQTGEIEGRATILAYSVFGGLILNLATLQIAFEGDYSATGVSGMGAKVSLRL